MPEYFVFANSFAAPFISDTSETYISGETPRAALEEYVKSYKNPAGLYFAALWKSADDYHKNSDALVTWTCNHELVKQRHTASKGAYSYLSKRPGIMEIDGEVIYAAKPKDGEFSEP